MSQYFLVVVACDFGEAIQFTDVNTPNVVNYQEDVDAVNEKVEEDLALSSV